MCLVSIEANVCRYFSIGCLFDRLRSSRQGNGKAYNLIKRFNPTTLVSVSSKSQDNDFYQLSVSYIVLTMLGLPR